MIACISTIFNCSEAELWEKISKPEALQFVAAPLLRFEPMAADQLDDQWVVGKPYELKLYFLNFLPLGRHCIKLVTIDKASNTIVSNESGTLASTWNHTIRFEPVEPNKLRYTDEIVIEAGWLTAVITAFAHIFYRHRQRRWKKLLATRRF